MMLAGDPIEDSSSSSSRNPDNRESTNPHNPSITPSPTTRCGRTSPTLAPVSNSNEGHPEDEKPAQVIQPSNAVEVKTCDLEKGPESSRQSTPPPSGNAPAVEVARRKKRRYEGWESDGFSGYMRQKNQKLRDQFEAEFSSTRGSTGEDGEALFRGVTVHVNGATKPSRDELRKLVGDRGGLFETYLTGANVTHVVCQQLAEATRIRLRKMVKSGTLHVVTPAWVVRSIEEGRLLPVAEFPVRGMTDPGQKNIASFFGKPAVNKRK